MIQTFFTRYVHTTDCDFKCQFQVAYIIFKKHHKLALTQQSHIKNPNSEASLAISFDIEFN